MRISLTTYLEISSQWTKRQLPVEVCLPLKDWYQIIKPSDFVLFISISNLLSSISTVVTAIASLFLILKNSKQKLMKLNLELIHVPSIEITFYIGLTFSRRK